MERRGKSSFTGLKIFGDADFEEKSLNRTYQDMTVDRDCEKTEWCKISTEFKQESFNLRFFSEYGYNSRKI
jgi:hypothetical protein